MIADDCVRTHAHRHAQAHTDRHISMSTHIRTQRRYYARVRRTVLNTWCRLYDGHVCNIPGLASCPDIPPQYVVCPPEMAPHSSHPPVAHTHTHTHIHTHKHAYLCDTHTKPEVHLFHQWMLCKLQIQIQIQIQIQPARPRTCVDPGADGTDGRKALMQGQGACIHWALSHTVCTLNTHV